MPRLEHPPQQYAPIRLRGAIRLDVNIRAVVSPEAIPRVGPENTVSVGDAPVRAEVEDRARHFRTLKGAANNGDGDAGAHAEVAVGPALAERGVYGVEELEARRAVELGRRDGREGGVEGVTEGYHGRDNVKLPC